MLHWPKRQNYLELLWFFFLCARNAPLVPEVLPQNSQVYVNVFGKCLDSTWFLTSNRSFWLWSQRVQEYDPSSILTTYWTKSSGVITPENTFIHWCLFMYFNYYHISHIITLHFFHVAFAYDLCKLCFVSVLNITNIWKCFNC